MRNQPSARQSHDPEPLGLRVKRLRSERMLSQDRLAIEAHVDQSGLSKFERGRRYRIGRDALERIAAVLGIAFEALVSGTDFETGEETSKETNESRE
jgi:transcriptional regulator with XRE-family HTH domain